MSLAKRAAPAALLALFALQSFTAMRLKSPVLDEPAHIAAGLSYVARRVFHANLQHPPLIKELSGVSMLFGGIRWPDTKEANDILARDVDHREWGRDWTVGSQILDANGADRTLLWARLPMIGVALLLGVAIYAWGRRLLGEGAALGALFLFTFDPNLIAHSYLVTTDVGLATFSVIFLATLWRYVQNPTLKGQILCGVALGCALCAKYSGVLLLPVAAVLLVAGMVARIRTSRSSIGKTTPKQPSPSGSGRKHKDGHGAAVPVDPRLLIAEARAFGIMLLVALGVIEVLYLFGNGPRLYLLGYHRVYTDHSGAPVYLAGELRARFTGYFAAAYLLKEPIAAILLAAAGIILLLVRKALAGADKLFLFFPPTVFFVAYSLWAADLGFRYIIPVLPFAYLAGGAALAWLFERASTASRVVAVALCAWTVSTAAGIYPDHLSYFNESACLLESPSDVGFDGGTRCGPVWLDDSNVDWGQSVKQLKQWLDRNANGRPVHIMPFTTYPPEKYGIQYTDPPPAPGPKPELYILSSHYVARMSLVEQRVRDAKPIAIVGHAFYVYEF